ncbi:MAG: TIR domain-containing protein [bacterium]|nr:TIR domain-containing protein [bacterium]
MKRVFVSYSRRNKTFAERLARDLNDAGLEVWVDWRQIQGGELWQHEIYRGIERSEIFVFCLTPDALASEWCQREAIAAREQGKFILPAMAIPALPQLETTEALRWMLDIQFINFVNRYEEAFPELLRSLPGSRRLGAYDDIDPSRIPNPFKGLEAFQQTDAHLFFGRETLIRQALTTLRQAKNARFLAVVGASGSGKSSLVRAGIIPEIREGTLPDSDQWPVVIFTPGVNPVDSLAQRLSPLRDDLDVAQLEQLLMAAPTNLDRLAESILQNEPVNARLVLVIDQFEEVFTRAGEAQRATFLALLHHAVTKPNGRTQAIITMRADFFDRLSRYPDLARLFEQENLLIVTEMTAADLLRAIEGPAEAVGLVYDEGLPQRILEDVRRQPGSLPLLQYALKELYALREGRRLTNAAYEQIGGVRRALASHAENIYVRLNAAQQNLMRRLLLRLVEVSATGEATRRRVARDELDFRDVSDDAVQEIINILTAPESRLLIASREIKASEDDQTPPTVYIEVGHEALIREWSRFTGWVAENVEGLRYGSELLQSANNWQRTNRDSAYLLTGNRLARAEDWLMTADANELQRQFIQASVEENDRRENARQQQAERELVLQRSAANRLRLVAVILVVGLAATVLLALFAVASLREAQAQEALAEAAQQDAEESARQAQSLALSASANRSLVDNDTDLAVMLAVSANQIADPPAQSQRTLAEVAYSPSTRRLITPGTAGQPVQAVAVSPDNRLGVSTSGSETIVWELDLGTEVRRFGGHSSAVTSAAFSPDGNALATAGGDGVIILWDLESGAEIQRFVGHRAGINSVSFSVDGTYLLSGGADWVVIMWFVETGAEFLRFQHEGPVNSAVFNRTTTRVASASDDDTVRIWNIGDGAQFLAYTGHNADVNAVAFNPGKSNLISASDDGTVRLWNASNGEDIAVFDEHEGRVIQDVIFSPDGAEALSAGDDGNIVIYNVAAAQPSGRFLGHSVPILDLAYSSSGLRLLSADASGVVRLWDTERAETIRSFQGHEISSIRTNFAVAVYGANEQTILSGAVDSSLRLWNSTTGLTIQQFLGHEERVNGVAMSSDGVTALSASSDDTVILWDIASGQPIRTLQGHTSDVQAVAYLPGNTQAISASSDATLILWNLETGEVIRRYAGGHNAQILDVVVSPDGTQALSASGDQTLVLWNVQTGEVIRTYSGHNSAVQAAAFSSDGTRFVSGAASGSVLLWDVVTGTTLQSFEGHDRAVLDVAFAPGDGSILTGSQDGTIRLWDVITGFELRRYDAGEGVHSVAFRSDGREIITGLSDATLRTWRVFTDLTDLMDWTFLNRYVRQPSCVERRIFQITPLCDAEGVAPTATPYPVPSVVPPDADTPRVTVGSTVTVNTDDGTNLRIRDNPGRNTTILADVPDGTRLMIIDGPVFTDSLTWWRVRTENGIEGWSAENEPNDGLQLLVP